MDHIFSAILQVLAFTFIPFLVYVIRFKKVKGFLNWIGLKKASLKPMFYGFAIALFIAVPVILLTIFTEDFKSIMLNPKSMTGKFNLMGFSLVNLGILTIDSFIKTGLSEEILFRGFLAKRLIAVTNFKIGNLIHAFIFGIIHSLIFLALTDNIYFIIFIFIFPAVASYIKVYINEKLANGSIIPSWIAHGSGNFIAYSVIGFMI